MEESCNDVLKKIYDTGSSFVPEFCRDIVNRAANKTNPVDEIGKKLMFYVLDMMHRSIKAGIELGNEGVTKENFKEWFNNYAKNKLETLKKMTEMTEAEEGDENKAFINRKKFWGGNN